ncbi:hypothetical protein U1Q18_034945 [Sarracenia purpurea var. burkii]
MPSNLGACVWALSTRFVTGFGKEVETNMVNVDDAVDDIVRQFKGVSDGLVQKDVSSSSAHEVFPLTATKTSSCNTDEFLKNLSLHNSTESAKSTSDNEEGDKDGNYCHEEVDSIVQANGWHSDNELNSKYFPPKVVKRGEKFRRLDFEKKHGSKAESLSVNLTRYPEAGFPVTFDRLEDPIGMPPEPWGFLENCWCCKGASWGPFFEVEVGDDKGRKFVQLLEENEGKVSGSLVRCHVGDWIHSGHLALDGFICAGSIDWELARAPDVC